jgi:hypothetical protein
MLFVSVGMYMEISAKQKHQERKKASEIFTWLFYNLTYY